MVATADGSMGELVTRASFIKVDFDVRYHAGSPEACTAHNPARGQIPTQMSQGVHDPPDVRSLTPHMSAPYHPCVRLLLISHISAVYHPYPCVNFARNGSTMSAKRPSERDNELG